MSMFVFCFWYAGIPCEKLQLSELLIRLTSFRGSRITLKQPFFGFHVDSEGASSVEVCARVCSRGISSSSFATTP